jgi:hypothetical protein
MILILLMSIRTPLKRKLDPHKTELAVITLLAGLWNTGWYGFQNLGDYWGNAAFISGLLMMLTSLPLLENHRMLMTLSKHYKKLPPLFNRIALCALCVCAALYAYALILMQFD